MKNIILLFVTLFLFLSCHFDPDKITLSSDDGLVSLSSKDEFDQLSSSIDVPGAFNQQEVKFLIMNVQKMISMDYLQ